MVTTKKYITHEEGNEEAWVSLCCKAMLALRTVHFSLGIRFVIAKGSPHALLKVGLLVSGAEKKVGPLSVSAARSALCSPFSPAEITEMAEICEFL